MPDTIEIKGRFSVPRSSPDAFGLPYPEAFFGGEDGTIGSQSFGCLGTNGGGTVSSSVAEIIAVKGVKAYPFPSSSAGRRSKAAIINLKFHPFSLFLTLNRGKFHA